MSDPDIQVATVELALSGGTVTLQPTARALMEISKRFGSVTSALQQVIAMNSEAIVTIVRVGGRVGDQRAKVLAEEIFAYGLAECLAPVSRYIAILLNGGRPPKDEDDLEGREAEGNA